MALEDLDALVIDSVTTLVIVLDQTGIVRFNRASERASGYSAHEVIGRPVWETLVAPEDRANVEREIKRVLAGELRPELPVTWLTRSGERRQIVWSRVMTHDAAGRVRYVIGTGTDVTEKLRAERELRQKEAWLGKLIETAHEGIGIIDPDGRFTYVNPRMCELVGFAADEILGRPFFEFMGDDVQEIARRRLQDRRRGIAEMYEVKLKRKDGSEFWVQIKTNPMLDENGRMVASLGMVSDISERRAAEAALRESEEKFRLAVEHSPDLMFYQDCDLRVTWVSRDGVTGPAREMLGKRDDELLPREEAQLQMAAKRRVMQTGVGERTELRIPSGDSYRYLEAALEPRRDSAGKLIGIAGYVRDITERKLAAEAQRALNEKLEQLVASRTAAVEQQSRILRSVLQSMGEAVIVADKDGQVILMNAAVERLAGPPRPEPHSVESCATPQRFFRSDGVTEYLPHEIPLARAVRGESVDNEEMFINRGDPAEGVWITATARPLLDEAGELAGGVLVARDTTGRHRVEQMVLQSERHFREMAERNRLLLQEVDHRVRNNLSALIGLIALMRQRTQSVGAFADAIESRIQGMAHVHQMLAAAGWQPVELDVLVESTLEAMQHLAPHRIKESVEGPVAMIDPKRALPLAMIVVEWFTNSCKYGAHSTPSGRLRVSWEHSENGAIHLSWKEQGGPPVSQPNAPSLGTELVRAFATRELMGASDSRFGPDGVEHRLTIQAEATAGCKPQTAAAPRSA
ncbi:MAG TPA: PAS domain S-box protein [Tepidisphaeraceae bacterium]|nr:PAS domain S-box protein [Tepidisphaeraceae bacterium]